MILLLLYICRRDPPARGGQDGLSCAMDDGVCMYEYVCRIVINYILYGDCNATPREKKKE